MTGAKNELSMPNDYKEMSREQLEYAFADVLGTEQFPTRPYFHQLATIAWAIDTEQKRIALWHAVGTGKTLTALYLALLWGSKRVLVVCPNSVVNTWEDEIVKHLPMCSSVRLQGSAKQRRDRLKSHADFYLINYEGLRVLFGRSFEGKKAPDKEAMVRANFDLVIIDECHHVASPQTQQTLFCSLLSQLAEHVIMMTGTPITGSILSLWAQYLVLDGGASLGSSYWRFRAGLFNHFGFDWKPKRGAEKKILAMIAPTTMRYAIEECMDLPDLIVEQRVVELSPELRKVYDAVLRGAHDDLETMGLPQVEKTANKLSQICSGFLIRAGSATEIGKTSKILELREILRSTAGLRRKVVICHSYTQEGRMIEQLCRKENLRSVSMRGEVGMNERTRALKLFRDGPVDVMIMHPRTAGEGLNLQHASVLVFFSIGFLGAVGRQQTIGRIYRAGQTESCLVIDLVTSDSVEPVILKALEQRVSVAQAVVDYIRDH